jgi:hypothetical protein
MMRPTRILILALKADQFNGNFIPGRDGEGFII